MTVITMALKSLGIQIGGEPCLRCGKVWRHNYSGFCMDCVDELGISELFDNTPAEIRLILKKDYEKEKWFIKTGKAWGEPPVYSR